MPVGKIDLYCILYRLVSSSTWNGA